MERDILNNARGNPISSWHLDERLECAKSLVPMNAINILDVGCGEGYFLEKLAKERQVNAIGIDTSNKNITFARKLVPNAKFYVQNLFDLRFDKETFDCVVTLEVIDHLEAPQLAIMKISQLLRHRGTIILSYPENSILWKTVWFFWTRSFGWRWINEHVQSFHASDMAQLLKKCGFGSIKNRTAFFGMINVTSAVKED